MRRQWSRRARITMLSVAMVASACAGAEGVSPAGQSSSPTTSARTDESSTTTLAPSTYGGTVVVGIADGGSPRSLNPLLDGPDVAVLDLLAPAIFAQAFDTDPVSGRRVPDAMAAVPSLEDGTILDNGDGTFDVELSVVAGAQWADGTPVSGDDLAFTHRVVTDPSLPIRRDVADAHRGVIPGSVVVDGPTIRLRMQAGSDPTDLFSVILPRHEVEGSDFSRDWDDRTWVAGGPFVIADWQPGQFVELVRNDRYWKVTAAEGAPLPFLDRIVVRFYEPGDALDARLVEAFTRSELAVAVFGHAERRSEPFADAVEAGAELLIAPGGEWEHLNFQFGPANRNTGSQNASLAFRRAVAHAIDRQAIADARNTAVAQSILERFVPQLGESPFDRYGYDPDETARLLGGGAPPVVVTVPGDDASGLALGGDVVTMLRDAGFDAELQLEDSELFFGSTLDNGSWDVGVWRNGSAPGLQAAADFIRFYDPDGLPFVGVNYFRWGTVDSLVDDDATRRYRAIVDALDVTVDPAAVADLLVEAEQILAEQAVLLPLVLAGDDGLAVWPDLVRGAAINPAQGPFWNVDVWRVPSSE